MTWTTAVSQVTGTLITASIYNGQLIGNLNHLYARPLGYNQAYYGTDIATTSTSFVDVDPTFMSLTFSLAGTQVICMASFVCVSPSSAAPNYDFIIGATRAGNAVHGVAGRASGNLSSMTIFGRFVGLTPGSKTVKLQHKSNGVASGVSGTQVASIMAWEV
ncbi:hypothetical protein G4Y79_15335 [Phototrophicus methaneseepsis]|uniref:Uncharacterized protein n=1 Tax=Phototrophicus methaneseepsis TaxID=2710758 RepID=A0A7S8ID15_9CHLR|nr:hypothetical protein [Phototrophicus methaneseepsis]QPC81076.1 hypothetical protein G4Y79_15335 [Phototrophicus methaneseepsis]